MNVTDNDFEEKVINRSKKEPVVVDFYADWCMPCKMLGPVLEKVAKKNNMALVKVNVDEAQLTADRFDISGIPDVRIFKDGKVSSKIVGMMPEDYLDDWLKQNK